MQIFTFCTKNRYVYLNSAKSEIKFFCIFADERCLEPLEDLELLENLVPLEYLDHLEKKTITHSKNLHYEKPCYASIPTQANQLEESVVLSKG